MKINRREQTNLVRVSPSVFVPIECDPHDVDWGAVAIIIGIAALLAFAVGFIPYVVVGG